MTEPISDEELDRLRVIPHVISWFDPLIARLDAAESKLAAAEAERDNLRRLLHVAWERVGDLADMLCEVRDTRMSAADWERVDVLLGRAVTKEGEDG